MKTVKFIKTKSLSGNPVRIHASILNNGLIVLDKYVYSNQPLRYFEVVKEFPQRFGRTLYRQEIVFNKETFYSLQFLLEI